jgi:Protein of unknown function (DUF3341)
VSAALGLVAEFRTADELSRALAAARREGYTAIEAFAPFPMRDEERAFAYRTWLIPFLATIAACIGAAIQYYSQYWMNAVDYPINVGGRPLHSWPAFIPSTVIVAILWAGAAALLGMLLILGLPRLHHPLFAVPGFRRASEDRFFLLIESRDPLFEAAEAAQFLARLEPLAVQEVRP